MLIDSHCHLEKFHRDGTLAAALDRAAEAGVDRLITVGTGRKDWPLYHDLARLHAGRVFWTAGLHPSDAEESWEEDIMLLSTYFTTDPLPCAMGEIGLDHFHLPKFPDEAAEIKARQVSAFRAQLDLALQMDCPVVVHSRGAFTECVRCIDESGIDWARVVFHCFADGPDEMRALAERGARASFTGIVTYKSADTIREAARVQGLDRLMVETDAPYLTPEPHRGKPNEPAYVRHTAERLAEVLRIDLETLAATTTRNAERFFRLGESSVAGC